MNTLFELPKAFFVKVYGTLEHYNVKLFETKVVQSSRLVLTCPRHFCSQAPNSTHIT